MFSTYNLSYVFTISINAKNRTLKKIKRRLKTVLLCNERQLCLIRIQVISTEGDIRLIKWYRVLMLLKTYYLRTLKVHDIKKNVRHLDLKQVSTKCNFQIYNIDHHYIITKIVQCFHPWKYQQRWYNVSIWFIHRYRLLFI